MLAPKHAWEYRELIDSSCVIRENQEDTDACDVSALVALGPDTIANDDICP
jgi:hypothetical protein